MGIFTHDSAGMGTRRVEVSEEGGVPVVAGLVFFLEIGALGLDVVGDATFHGGFGAAIGVRGANWAIFGNRNHVGEPSGVAINGSGRGKDNVGNIVFGH